MAETSPVSCLPQIGEVAGVVWRTLSENGPLNTTKLVKAVNESRDVVMLAVGWLAREDKINITEKGRNRIVALR